jgi:hypothetical protein
VALETCTELWVHCSCSSSQHDSRDNWLSMPRHACLDGCKLLTVDGCLSLYSQLTKKRAQSAAKVHWLLPQAALPLVSSCAVHVTEVRSEQVHRTGCTAAGAHCMK